jgi:hypothetical protein
MLSGSVSLHELIHWLSHAPFIRPAAGHSIIVSALKNEFITVTGNLKNAADAVDERGQT